jgi:hypothetical protein
LSLLGGEIGTVRRAGPLAVGAGGAQLVCRPFRPWLGSEVLKGVGGRREVGTGIGR